MNFTKPAALYRALLQCRRALIPALSRAVYRGLAVLLFMTASASGQLANSPWPDYGGGYANQHRSAFAGSSDSAQILWAFDLATISTGFPTRGHHQPILLPDGGIVVNTMESGNGQIVAINPNGTLRWFNDEHALGPWLAADANKIYTIINSNGAANSDRLLSISFNGSIDWHVSLPGTYPTQNGPAIGRNGAVYAADDFSSLVAITPAGAITWTSEASGYYVNPAIASDGTIVIGGSALTAISTAGVTQWQVPTRTVSGVVASYLSPAIADDGTIYAGQVNVSNLVAVTPAGAQIWARPDLGGAPAIGPNGTVYVVPETGILSALNPIDGSTLWTYPTGKTDYYNAEGVTVDANGNLYVSNEDGILISLTSSGQLRWSLDLAPDNSGFIGLSAPVIGSNGVLYVAGGNTGRVFAISVPEPATVPLLLSAAISIMAIARYSRSRIATKSSLRK